MNISNYSKFMNSNTKSQQLNITTLVNNNNEEQNENGNVALINTIFNNANRGNLNRNKTSNKYRNGPNKYEIKQYSTYCFVT